ncbi:MAG: ABC transporter ATP-binding protein [Candidatus Hodarchaeales archaeon]|jgi:ABC-2 type transport system ATP-binding protein
MIDVVIETNDLTKIYDNRAVVDHLNIIVKKGELLSILGPNGAGKTTIIKMLTTVLKPDEGTASINEINIRSEVSAVKTLIGVVPQEHVFYEELTARENMVFFGTMHGFTKKELKEEADRILEKLGFADRNDKTKNFSGGMKRRLNIAVALIMKPQILFLDEPTAGLDPQAKHVVWDYIKELKMDGKTIILTTHDMFEAEMLSDRVLIMDNGKVIAEGSPDALKDQYSEKNILEIIFKEKEHVIEFKEKIESLKFLKDIIIEEEKKMNIYFDGGIINFIKILQSEVFYDLTEFESLSLRQTTLEDVFLHLTGRRLRE